MFGIDVLGEMDRATDPQDDLGRLRRKVKKIYKSKALTEHPDKGGDEESWKVLTNAYNMIQKIEYKIPRRKMRMVGLVIEVDSGKATVSAATGWWYPI